MSCGSRLPEEKSSLLLESVLSTRAQVGRELLIQPRAPLVRRVEWRFGLIRRRSEGLEAGILLRIDTTEGPVSLRVSLKTFHSLRFSVAKAFSELKSLGDKVCGN